MTATDERGTHLPAPGDPAYEAATQVFNLSAPARPAAALTALTVEDVRAAVRAARSRGLSVRVHATGHAAPTARPMDSAVLIRTRLTGGVTVDADARVARVPAGTLWGEVVEAAAAHGLAAPHGTAPNVGAVGYLLRGGVSFYGRRTGVAANSVRAIELVTADGESRRVDAASDPELFWALRGGGGGFGVVTAVEVELFPASVVVTGAAFWQAPHHARVLSRWLEWTRRAPREAATSMRVMNLPPLPEIPPELTSGPVLCVAGAVLGTDGDDPATAERQADELLAPLRAVGDPVFDTWHTGPPSDVLDTHMDPAEPFAILGDHMLLSDLGEEGAERFLRLAGEGSNSPLVAAELRQLGGALAEPDPAGGALSRIEAPYAFMAAGVCDGDPATDEAILGHCAALRAALAPWDTGRTAPTFVEKRDRPQGHLSAEQIVRLDRIRERVDPTGLFRGDISPNASALASALP
ncbi:FAD-binding protein [Streptomyces sp. O3]